MSKTLRLLTTRQVCAMIGVSRATLDRWVDDGTFPAPLVIRTRADGRPTSIRWRIEDVLDWLHSRR